MIKENIKKLLSDNTNLEAIKILKELVADYEKDTLGTKIINHLGEDHSQDETYGWFYEYDSEHLKDDELTIFFNIEYGHFEPNNDITINFKEKNVTVTLGEAFEAGGGEEELEEIITNFLNNNNYFE